MHFTSDNAAGAHPAILSAVVRAAEGPAMGYGNDPLTGQVEARIREIFEAPEARVFLIATGTAANAVSLACLCPPWGAVYAHQGSHIEEDECGAPEFYTGGAKLTVLGGVNGKIDADELARTLDRAALRGLHNVQKGALSLTQATELGAVYTLAETARLTTLAHEAGIPVQMDGARFANAVAGLGCTPAEASWKAGVDVLCFGATKNGALAAEAVIFFDPEKSPGRTWEFELRRKRGGHLFSKMRFVAAQMDAYLTDDLWLSMAGHANAMAARLASGLAAAPGCRIVNSVDANMIFVEIPLATHRRLQDAGARYYPAHRPPPECSPPETPFLARLVCSFETTEEEVDRFVKLLRE